MSASSSGDCATSARRSRVTTSVAGISRPSMPSSRRYSLSRSRLPTSLGGLSSGRGQFGAAASILRSASRQSSESEAITIATSCSGSGAGSSASAIDIEHHQLDAGFLEQEFDRRVAAHVGRRRQRQHAQPRIACGARRCGTADASAAPRAGSQGPPACRRAVARSATGRSPRPRPRVPFSSLAISSVHLGRRSRAVEGQSWPVWPCRCDPRIPRARLPTFRAP